MWFWRQISDISGQIWILCCIFNSETATNWISSLSFSVLRCRALCAERGLVLIHHSPSVLSTLHLLIPSLILLPSASLCLPAASSFTSLLLILSLLSSFTLLFTLSSLVSSVLVLIFLVCACLYIYVCMHRALLSFTVVRVNVYIYIYICVGGSGRGGSLLFSIPSYAGLCAYLKTKQKKM